MVLEELLELLRKVREKAEKYRADLEKSEALTRYALIDPVLRALGWNTEDPSLVRPEFTTDTGTPDYALLWEGKPLVMVEAKALGKKLEGAQDKAFHYAYQNGVPYFVTTDGLRWELYDVFERDKEKRKLFAINLAEGEAQAARFLLALWRPAMPEVIVPTQFVVASLPPPKGRFSLAELLAKMERKEIPGGSKPPDKLHLPDGKTVSIKYWRDLLTALVEWATEHKRLPVPVRFPSTERVLVAKTPEGMRAPKEVRGYYVETHASAVYVLKFAQTVLAAAGLDPKDFQVTL